MAVTVAVAVAVAVAVEVEVEVAVVVVVAAVIALIWSTSIWLSGFHVRIHFSMTLSGGSSHSTAATALGAARETSPAARRSSRSVCTASCGILEMGPQSGRLGLCMDSNGIMGLDLTKNDSGLSFQRCRSRTHNINRGKHFLNSTASGYCSRSRGGLSGAGKFSGQEFISGRQQLEFRSSGSSLQSLRISAECKGFIATQ